MKMITASYRISSYGCISIHLACLLVMVHKLSLPKESQIEFSNATSTRVWHYW